MENQHRLMLRIESNFAACESTYWISFCTISGFIAVFLSHRGLSNTEIGLTTSLGCLLAIVLQLCVSNFLDRHPEFRIKRLISALFLAGMAMAAAVNWLDLPIAMMIIAYATAYALGMSNNGYLNAQFVQFNNAGIPVRYGWPRGVGSFFYAVAAYIYGKLVQAYTPDILMPCYLVGTVVCICCVLMMPVPDAPSAVMSRRHTSYREMLSGNRELVVLLLCVLLNSIGNTAGYTFILRVVEKVGCGTVEYGISELIRAGAEVPALFASGLLLKHFKVKSMLAASYVFYGLRLLLLAVSSSIGLVYCVSAINMLCVGLSTFTSVLMVNSIVRENEKVRGQSLCVLCGSIGSIIGNAYGGAMIDQVGLNAMLLTSAVFCFAAFTGMILFCKPAKK